jgi:hypothetical protein
MAYSIKCQQNVYIQTGLFSNGVGLSFPKACLELKHPNHQTNDNGTHRNYRNLRVLGYNSLRQHVFMVT